MNKAINPSSLDPKILKKPNIPLLSKTLDPHVVKMESYYSFLPNEHFEKEGEIIGKQRRVYQSHIGRDSEFP